MSIDVLVEIKASSLDKTFTYLVPNNLETKIKIGVRVIVPFGKQRLEGFVLAIFTDKTYDYPLKEMIEVTDEEPILNKEMLELGEYLTKKTLCNLISAYQTMLPKALKAKKDFSINNKKQKYLILNKNASLDIKLTPLQQAIISLFDGNDEVIKSSALEISASATKSLLNKHILCEDEREVYRINNDCVGNDCNITLNDDQVRVINRVKEELNNFHPFLLHGLTGSGKTEVYMHVIEDVLKEGKESIVLVPEINLTPQMVATFRNRFGSRIAILHSRLNDGERYDEWRKIVKKEVSIVIGTRSAIFAPLTNLGVIIIDEEHVTSYKQENNPRYNAIDMALWRARYHKCPIILGSATPSIESYTRAKTGVYELLELKRRVNNNLPDIKLIDMHESIKKGHRILSKELIDGINDSLSRNEQVIILLNRRGYSTVITCKSCGFTDKCPHCDIPLTYHRTSNTMQCHYCGYTSNLLMTCPKCHSKDINYLGMGTEKLEEIIKKTFPDGKVIRMDLDTTSKKNANEQIIEAFQNEEYNILIGTQMIAKGLNFPKVSLVGVINGDASLNIPDFRASERTFQLLSQVAGRAGRKDIKGHVIIQSFNIDHYSILYALKQDYLGFINEEMKIRKILKYPPYYNLALINLYFKDDKQLLSDANNLCAYLKTTINDNNIILGPSPALNFKINNIYNLQIIIKYKNYSDIKETLESINTKYHQANKVKLEIDLNPLKI